MPLPDPVIVVPGITATYLRDMYPMPPDTIWNVLSNKFESTALHPDELVTKPGSNPKLYETKQPSRIVADQLFEVCYEDLIEELRHDLSPDSSTPVPVYPFGYDWRQPLELVQRELSAFIDEVIERTCLMRHYFKDGYDTAKRRKVNLIGHSMGGLVIAGYIATEGGAKVNKVATLASPFQGSFEAIIKVTTGTANLGTKPPSSRERTAARVTPALYYLIPSFKSGFEVADGLSKDPYDIAFWQPSIIDTIADYFAEHSVEPGNSKAANRKKAEDAFKNLLKMAKTHRKSLDKLDLTAQGLSPERWLAIVGVDETTRVKLKVAKDDKGLPTFDFASEDRGNAWKVTKPKDRRYTGDGTVPFEGAIPKFLKEENLVCLSPDDFGYWEMGDKVMKNFGGYHGILPNMNVIHRILTRFFTDAPDSRGNTWGRMVPGISEQDWKPPLKLTPK